MRLFDIKTLSSMLHVSADFCDIPELMQHLQDNYKFWTSEEEHPTSNYDLSIKGQEDSNDSENKSTESSSSTENIDNRTSEDT